MLLVMLALHSCSGSKYNTDNYAPPPTASAQPDYSNLYYWAAHPGKHNASDSTPEPFRNFVKDTTADVFFIHPTTYTDDAAVKNKPMTMQYWNAGINDPELNAKTDYYPILNQASVFNKYRVFAPRYRQAHIKAFGLPDSTSRPFFDTAYADIKAAFTYYLQHYNNGRPFIIAAHSQGTKHAARLIAEMIENTDLQNRMVIAYIIGLPVPTDYFVKCKPCTEPNQTGCFVSWRTFKSGYIPDYVQKEKFAAFNINPLTFSITQPKADRSQNKGAVLYKFNKPKMQNVATEVHGNVLWSTKPRFFGNIFMTYKNYHIGDINLFWKNIRDDADERVKAFMKK
jgi:hypothetical protein